ncbi:MAG: eukaryotic porin/Tom40 [Benjaminiella poitrasii]|nr:MAG: eukaryotic porin/Tom40 [Benjaminiella poitrasii]
MSIPVSFNDIERSARDILLRDYPIGGFRLDVRSSTSHGMSFKVNGQRDNKTGMIVGGIESRCMNRKTGLSLTQAWTSSNQLNSRIELDNSLAKGLKLEATISVLPSVMEKRIRFASTFKRPAIHSTASFDVSKNTLIFNSVIGRQGFLVGGELIYNVKEAKINRYNTAIGYSARDYAIAIRSMNDFQRYSASYYHRVDERLEGSGKASWTSNKTTNGGRDMMSKVELEIGAKYRLDPTSFIKGKITNAGVVGASYSQLIRPGAKINMGIAIDTTRWNESTPKLGIALTLEN